jgi:KUP system potassium uptake protein
MSTWHDGRGELVKRLRDTLPIDLFLADVAANPPHRVPGTAIFLTSRAEGTPIVLLHHIKHNQVLHARVVLLTLLAEEYPTVPDRQRVEVEAMSAGFWRVTGRFGFMEQPNVPQVLRACRRHGLEVDEATATFYLGRESLLTGGRSRMSRWRKALFAILSRNARPATQYFDIPPNRVVELGAQIEL